MTKKHTKHLSSAFSKSPSPSVSDPYEPTKEQERHFSASHRLLRSAVDLLSMFYPVRFAIVMAWDDASGPQVGVFAGSGKPAPQHKIDAWWAARLRRAAGILDVSSGKMNQQWVWWCSDPRGISARPQDQVNIAELP